MKAIKKPVPIEVEKFQPHYKPWPIGVELDHDGKSYFVWNELHGSRIGIKPGDYVNVTDRGDVYPIDAVTFSRTYDIVKEGSEE